MDYILTKIKENVYSIKIFNNNFAINKILKISVNIEEYFNEYNIYKELLDENKNYNIENISNYLKYENINKSSNIDIIFNDNLTVNIPVVNLCNGNEEYQSSGNIINLYILYGNYNTTSKTLHYYLALDDLNFILNLIDKALINRRNASNTKNLKHCDFKTNNVLVDNSHNVYLFDFDFSVILKTDDNIKITDDDKINLYLNVQSGHKISGMFLDLFDIYLLALSVIYYYGRRNINKLVNLQNLFETNLINKKPLCDDFYVFFIVYSNILLNLPIKFCYNVYLKYATFDVICDIVKNPIIEFTLVSKFLFDNNQYLNAIKYIKNAINSVFMH